MDEYGNVASSGFTTIKTVSGASKRKAVVGAAWEKTFVYRVLPYAKIDGKVCFPERNVGDVEYVSYALAKPTVSITSAKVVSGSRIQLKWKAENKPNKYLVYCAEDENYGYKCIATTTATTYRHKVKRGKQCCYKVVAVYKGSGKVASPSYVQVVPTASSKKAAMYVRKFGDNSTSNDTSLYTEGSTTYIVVCNGRKLKISGYNKKMKRVSVRTVKLPAYKIWGGFYHGPDGCNYVAIGYPNSKENTKKTVIKVVKYSSEWKRGKIAIIAGGVSNAFTGIREPFTAGDVSFDMSGSMLYLKTARTMFMTSDGLCHQSNIAFKINTKTMKAQTANDSYVSHSFEQRVRFKDGDLFQLDRGDAYPRSMVVTQTKAYGTSAQTNEEEINVFPFMGETGVNYTGSYLGDLEVGRTNILTCGTAQPHYYKVKGVTGWGDYAFNAYLTVTNRKTGKNKVVWLTTYNPKSKKTHMYDCGMVKISDDRFAVVYSVTVNNKRKTRCVFVDGNGKRIATRTYNNLEYGGQQLTYSDGKIMWVSYYSSKLKTVITKISAF